MKYKLIEEYFETQLFQHTVQDYFDTVLGRIIADKTTLAAKGLYIVDGDVKADYYDMPYHIHILNGLIPALFVYEKYLQEEGWIENSATNIYLRIFILGFTFHDANKLLGIKQDQVRSDLENAMIDLDNHFEKWAVSDFLEDFETHKSTVKFLALGTEHGSAVASNEYKISVKNWKHVNEIQRELCHLADTLASILNDDKRGIDHLSSIENIYRAIKKGLDNIRSSKIPKLRISYIKVRQNPYTLLSQNLLQVAQKQLRKLGKKVLFATREGFVFWGEDVTDEEYDLISKAYLIGSTDDIKFEKSTKITAEKCKFGFIDTTPFTTEILEKITQELADKFLLLSPNCHIGNDGKIKINDFENFVTFTKKLKDSCDAPIEEEVKDGKLTLRFYDNEKMSEEDETFRTVYNLHKIQWLNTKENQEWKTDFDNWTATIAGLPETIEIENEGTPITLKTVGDIRDFIEKRVNSTNALYKTYFNLLKTHLAIKEIKDIDRYISELKQNILVYFTPKNNGTSVKQALFDRYFECRGNVNLQFLKSYNPLIPLKKEMCAFTGGTGKVKYEDAKAFSLKSNGFNNRTITSLANSGSGTSHVSELFNEENILRDSIFKVKDANMVIYNDFFETNLPIDRDIIQACVKAKNELHFLEDGTILFDKKDTFLYNMFNLEFIKLEPKVKSTFHWVRKCLRMVKFLGIRSYITGIMTPYQPHKAVFRFENPPQFLKYLEWNNVRLSQVDEVLDEMRLVLTFGNDRIESNLLKIAKSRLAYFSLYYQSREKQKIYNSLSNFYKNYKNQKFNDMTVIEELAELAVDLMAATYGEKPITRNSSGASQTWLIRKSTEVLRVYIKLGSKRDYIIQILSGEINRKYQVSNSESILAFAEGFYQKLFIEHWKEKLPPKNIEKEFIYAFAFIFTNKSEQYNSSVQEEIRENYAKKLKQQLTDEGLEINEINIKNILSDKAKKYSNQYLEIIQKL